MSLLGSFGRRASDGGANLQIYYPASGNAVQAVVVDQIYPTASKDLRIGMDTTQPVRLDTMPATLECGDESNDEIQRLDHIFSYPLILLVSVSSTRLSLIE